MLKQSEKLMHRIRNLLQEIVGLYEVNKTEEVYEKIRQVNKLLIELEQLMKQMVQ